jgi:hypothetical protein
MVLDIHGSGFRPEHQARFFRPKDAVTGLSVGRQRVLSGTLIQVIVQVDAAAAAGPLSLALADGQGGQTNVLTLEVAK